MSLQLSTGLRNHLLITGNLKAAVDNLVIKIFSGTPPLSPDDALSGNTELVEIGFTEGGTPSAPVKGCIFNGTISTDGVLEKNGDLWDGEIQNSGIATFYRLVDVNGDNLAADDGSLASTTAIRIQGTVGVTLADMNFSDVNFVATNIKQIDVFNLVMPIQC